MQATTAARPSSSRAMREGAAFVMVSGDGGGGGAVAVGEGDPLVTVTLEDAGTLAGELGEGADGEDPELDIAFCLNASAVLSPVRGGLTAKTMPDVQSEPTEEKNLQDRNELG